MTGQEKQIHTRGVLFSISASKENTAGDSVTWDLSGKVRGHHRPRDTSRAGKEGAGEGGRGIHTAAAARPLSQGSGLTTRGIKPPPLRPTTWAVFTPWSMNSSALLVDPPPPFTPLAPGNPHHTLQPFI